MKIFQQGKEISKAELLSAIDTHELLINSLRKEGKSLDLTDVNLRGADLRGAGAGRVMSRTQAKKEISINEGDKSTNKRQSK